MRKKYMRRAAAALLVFLISTVVFYRVDPADAMAAAWIDEKELGTICVGQIVPEVKKLQNNEDNRERTAQTGEKDDVKGTDSTEKEEKKAEKDSGKSEKTVRPSGDPLVIIYHTHASESYMPYKESNYHREAEKGTVRDVGDVLEAEQSILSFLFPRR